VFRALRQQSSAPSDAIGRQAVDWLS